MILLTVIGRIRQYGSIVNVMYADNPFQKIDLTQMFGNVSDFAVSFRTLLDVVEGVPEKLYYKYGVSYLGPILVVIPRAAWPEKPLDISNEYTMAFYPGYYQLGGGIRCFIVSEAYVNFGYLGMAVMSMYGFFFRLMYSYLQCNRNNKSAILLYAASIPFTIDYIRGSFFSGTYTYLQAALLPCLIGLSYFSKRLKRRETRRIVPLKIAKNIT